jgi:hypothetical protein
MSSYPGPEPFIEKLRKDHEISAFDGANPALNAWLQKFAWANFWLFRGQVVASLP